MKKNGFTLIELLAVVVILALTFMFIAPKLSSLIKEGENTDKRLIEEQIIDSKDIEKLDGFVGVKVELLDEDKFNYVVMYGEN